MLKAAVLLRIVGTVVEGIIFTRAHIIRAVVVETAVDVAVRRRTIVAHVVRGKAARAAILGAMEAVVVGPSEATPGVALHARVVGLHVVETNVSVDAIEAI